MDPFRLLLILFVAVPILEIYLLIKVGSALGIGPTVGFVILTAVLGAALLRQQGLATLTRFQTNLAHSRLPAMELLEGAVLIVGGALLLTPGFFTDGVGFLCLIPLTRRAIIRLILPKLMIVPNVARPPKDSAGRVIEGEFTDHPDK